MVTRLGGVVGLCLALGASSAARSAPPCHVETSVEPARAFVGQQVLFRARVHSLDEVVSVEWQHPPSFPSFRTENLPADPRPARSERDGVLYRVQDEVRALFGDREGRFTLRAPVLLCHVGAARTHAVEVPDVELEIVAFPAEGRPEDFAGIVGALALLVTVTPEEVALGETLRVAVMARGTGNLWDLAAPFAGTDFEPAEVFARRPERETERGRALFLREHYVYDIVPRQVGELRVPEIAIPYFDPESGLYRVARTEAVRVPVRPRAAPLRLEGGDLPVPSPPRAGRSDGGSQGTGRWLALAAALIALAAVIFWRRRDRSSDRRAEAKRWARSAAVEEDPGDRANALARALRAALASRVPDAPSVTPEALLARPGLAPSVAAAARLLAEVERARFDPAAEPPDAEAVLRAIGDL